jgi:hypothetical protein
MGSIVGRGVQVKKVLLAMAMTTLLAAPAWSGKENYGKADDYGSARYAAINQCVVDIIMPKPGEVPLPLTECMKESGFKFCPNCRVWGNEGPRCKKDDGFWHSWCWE